MPPRASAPSSADQSGAAAPYLVRRCHGTKRPTDGRRLMGGSRASRPGRRGWPQATTVATELGGVSAKVLAVASVLVVIAVVVVVWLAPSSGGTSASEVIARAAAAHIPGLTCNAPAPDPNVQRYNRDAAEVATAAQCQPGNTWAVTLSQAVMFRVSPLRRAATRCCTARTGCSSSPGTTTRLKPSSTRWGEL
jgi:hypothetical protein